MGKEMSIFYGEVASFAILGSLEIGILFKIDFYLRKWTNMMTHDLVKGNV